MYYHASNVANIKELIPSVSMHGTPFVYLTTKRENALVYLSNAVEKYCKEIGLEHSGKYYKWCSYGFTKDGILELQEYWPDAVVDTYAGVSGYIYSAENVTSAESMKDNETFEECAIRETREETGLNVSLIKELGICINPDYYSNELGKILFYLATPISDEIDYNAKSDNATTIFWLDYKEILDLKNIPPQNLTTS